MCGIFGMISDKTVDEKKLRILAMHSRQRGKEFSGIVYNGENGYRIVRADYNITKVLNKEKWSGSSAIMGFSSPDSNVLLSYQPVVNNGSFLIRDGIIVNEQGPLNSYGIKQSEKNSELITEIALKHFEEGGNIAELPRKILSLCEGTISAILALPGLGKALLFSNCGSLYVGENIDAICFASERYPLKCIDCHEIIQIWQEGLIIDIPKTEMIEIIDDIQIKKDSSKDTFKNVTAEEAMLQYRQPDFKRCVKCLLPETMPFISFDSEGVCNYCRNYKVRNKQKPIEELFEIVKPYRRKNESDCIVPFSGGRDSSYSLHLIVNELKMNPIAYTYDWGMVTDLGHRNISRMCSKLGVENIVVAADILKKRRNIEKNLKAWLKAPHLGMVSILTAGDKHFFQHIETIKKQTGINLNLWGINPLEVTHFKSGFLGIKPNFEEKRVYMPGVYNQLKYQAHRFKTMLQNPDYFNSSLWDTLSGEYYRSFAKKKDYFHIFDYWCWDERTVDETLKQYDWETAPDTNTTWRIGDGTAALCNYIYYTVAGFTEHDTFRSNQIREGQITRAEALKLVEDENRPRYENIRWYLDTLNMDFSEVITVINSIPKLY